MLTGVLALLRGAPEYNLVRDALRAGASPAVLGPTASAAAALVAAVVTDPSLPTRPALVIAPSQDVAERLADDLRALLHGADLQVHVFPAGPGPLCGEDDASDDARAAADAAVGARLEILEALGRPPGGDAAGPDLAPLRSVVAIASVESAVEPLLPPAALQAATLVLQPGAYLLRDQLVAGLQAAGYERVSLVAGPGEFAVRGDVVDVFPIGASEPMRADLWGDEVERLRALDVATQRAGRALPAARIWPARIAATASTGAAPLAAFLAPGGLLVLYEPAESETRAAELVERAARAGRTAPLAWAVASDGGAGRARLAVAGARCGQGAWTEVRLPAGGIEAFGGQTHLLAQALSGLLREGLRVVIASAQAARVADILADAGVDVGLAGALVDPPPAGRVLAVPARLHRGFRLDAAGLAVVTDSEIVGWRRRRARMRYLRDGARLTSWADLTPGDLVVHVHHGIGRYRGLVQLPVDGSTREYLLLEYAQDDRLYVPVEQIHLVQRYIGAEGEQPRLHRLGGADWEREKRRVKDAAREMAAELLTLYAARASTPGHAFGPDTPWQREMEAAFPYTETPHQLKAIEDVKRDMEAPRPMDRLVAGDVGYGKTEVALRAAFKAVMDGKQVAVVVPTTILAQQHYSVFAERFAPFPVTVELLSRFRTPAEQKEILAQTAAGLVDVLIGTHRLLARDVVFRDLGLVIIDEEQRFGVRHKEHLKTLRKQVDVLTLTATPIPRTLHMALSGLRDLTVMETPPEARLPIHTEIRPDDDGLLVEAIRRELGRGGQVYVVHNRVETIDRAARRIRHLVPEATVAVAHGQMPEERLEGVMMDFLGGRVAVLVCTTIVEIGLDIPQVNTIIIEDAHRLGLAQLYQLRGRVGRADRQAYCYLLYPRHLPLTPEAEQRLRAMAEFVELGSGLGLAMRDLEIRGAGNLLGPEQHGHIAAVGFDLYCRLLDEAIREAKGEIVEEPRDPTLELGVDARLPAAFLPDEKERLRVYRRLAAARTPDEVDAVAAALAEAGPLPPPVEALLEVVRVRVVARQVGVTSITREGDRYVVRLTGAGHLDDATQRRLQQALGHRARVTAAGLTVQVTGATFAEQAGGLREVLALVGWVGAGAVPVPAASG
ncbi:MAG: transcription-repair coupling factor [Armatimonadota bacterium]|nr:transcription-repair coupling factor [Armatimonadota bacterium]MDR7533794.1 transcription-repair coupling factor [Armatimonadota bacterium]MDR7536677.1 transcription-repair coupling factor [Armatimonadota bacterium]